MLKERILTALVLAILAMGALFGLPVGGFGAALLLVVLPAAWEWARLAGFAAVRARLLYACSVLMLILALWPLLERKSVVGGLMALSVAGWAGALFWLKRFADDPDRPHRPEAVAAAGWVVLVTPWVALMALRGEYGPDHVLFLLLLVWVADIGAYFAGRRWGRRKLAPAISPGKTWEGAAGGGFATLLLALAGGSALGVGGGWPGFLAVCMITVAFSVVGDLFESMMKRQCGLKDSGSLLPGHGGVLDRVDSLSAAAPVFLLGLYGIGG
ncbi:MAG: phosphatidate cytidylyltransferase [Candidatus Competibacteraceae bacterium]|nr:phosphatidate cytidylyltransferase [Candidatus Competibacteraceae bacterium]